MTGVPNYTVKVTRMFLLTGNRDQNYCSYYSFIRTTKMY